MKKQFLFTLTLLFTLFSFAQEKATDDTVKGIVVNAQTELPMDNVHVLNLNQVLGTITNEEGAFEISAKVNDTLYFSFIGYKSFSVRVTNDMLKFQNTKVSLTEMAYALEDVVVRPFQLTGYLEIDSKNIPISNAPRYSISGLNIGYEGGKSSTTGITSALGALFNPADFLHKLFGKKPKQMRKLRKMQENDEIRSLLSSKFDRETLAALLQVNTNEIDDILRYCNYSDDFIKSANDLQILDAISACYEEYKVLNRNNK
ncbi:CarboxypepD_reg-like domain-containing protein [Zhouia amylolytica]|uniref:CarboxypepD_reg-like domain-containing protein n=1 Tax=Zhouia amylolytica TaxID=376730 RepID=A0A1I6QL47_9FLAO|nr:carboxypeptidase-like regulatory domain-containing protein [Zhouia amylolytica]SFS53092.1 CarboxypepD_reg-like domain-containing protein [Zhouia amylolytica]